MLIVETRLIASLRWINKNNKQPANNEGNDKKETTNKSMTTTTNTQPGYKQTEVGVIPEDWEVKSIGEVLKIHHGRSQKEVVDVNGEYPILASGGQIGKANDYLYNKPSVLIGRKGTIDVPQYVETPFWTVDTLFYSVVFENNVPKLLYYIFQLIDWYQYNEASGVPSLNARTIEKIQIPLPPTKSEQTAIATALSDMDALISTQEQLIAKKRAIKQGAMQELLEKKEGWEEIKLGQIGRFSSSSVDKIYRENDYEVFLLNYMDVYRNKVITPTKIPSRTTANTTQLKNHDLRKGDVLFTPTSETPDDIGHSALILHDLSETVFSYHLMRLRFNDNKLLDEFKPYILNSQSLSQYFFEKATGSTRYVLKKSDFENAPITIPSTIKEQTRIAQILSDMDAEIEQLGKELAKYRDMKKGMMEELLTGRKRLTF